jgi:hypothetical protein
VNDPYADLGTQILAAARRQESSTRSMSVDPRRHLRVLVLAILVLLVGATIALAAGQLLSGSTVEPRRPLNPKVGEGIPSPGGSRLLSLRVRDPQGGPPWGMRIVHTTRGTVCVQVGRVVNGQLGELGTDGAFGNDGRFHALAPDVLPTNGPSSSNASCIPAGQTFSGSWANLDRNAAGSPDSNTTPTQNQREVSFGLLGSHALSVTYRTRGTSRVAALTSSTGAYMIVERASRPANASGFSSAFDSLSKRRPSPWGAVRAITYDFDGSRCSDGTGAKLARPCPTPVPAPSTTIIPTRSLHRPLHVRLKIRHHLFYRAIIEFTAPYAVSTAHQDYEVLELESSKCGGATASGRSLERDIKQGQNVRATLLSLFQFVGRCGRTQQIQVRFVNPEGPSAAYPRESIIVGSATITEPSGVRPARR